MSSRIYPPVVPKGSACAKTGPHHTPAIVPLPRTATPRLLDAVPVFRYVTAENAPNYPAIGEILVEVKEHYMIELRRDPRSARARASPFDLSAAEDLDRHLDQLADWKNLQRSYDWS